MKKAKTEWESGRAERCFDVDVDDVDDRIDLTDVAEVELT
jgi:hypothetical protein